MRGKATLIWTPTMSHGAGQRKAYTLIELMVVMALIGVLITLLLPSLKRSMDVAASTMCKNNLRQLGTSMMQYRIENDGWLPLSARAPGGAASGRPVERNGSWFTKLHPTYLADPLTLQCPEDPFGYRLSNDDSGLQDPAVADFASYGLNDFIMRAGGGYLAEIDAHMARRMPTRPGDTILAADLGPDRVQYSRHRTALQGPARNGSLMPWNDGFDPFSGMPYNPWVTMRHNHGINMLTLTHAVRSVGTVQVLNSPLRRYYEDCAAGGCTLCNEIKLFHYSFADSHLYWWTGPIPPR